MAAADALLAAAAALLRLLVNCWFRFSFTWHTIMYVCEEYSHQHLLGGLTLLGLPICLLE